MQDFFIESYQVLKPQLAGHGLVFFLYALFFFVAKPVLNYFNRGKDVSFQVRAMRLGIVVIFFLHLLDIFIVVVSNQTDGDDDPQHFFIRLGYSIAAVYVSLIAFNIISYFSRKKFGLEKKYDGEVVYLDTYNSRLIDIVGYVAIFFFWIYIIIFIWGLDSLLETTGFIGLTLGFLALTNGIWLPDIYYGMVILNSNMLEDGDVIKYGNHSNENVISRVTFVYTILLDVRNNHRLLVRNSELIRHRIDNLTKRASIDGLRHSMQFKIGYPASGADRENTFPEFQQHVHRMFDQAFAAASEDNECKINRNMPFEVSLIDSADFALTFSLSFYLEALPNTKVTRTVRQFLVRTPTLIQSAVNSAAIENGIQLATPILINHVPAAGES